MTRSLPLLLMAAALTAGVLSTGPEADGLLAEAPVETTVEASEAQAETPGADAAQAVPAPPKVVRGDAAAWRTRPADAPPTRPPR